MKNDWILGQRAADGDDDAFLELYERNVAGIVLSLRGIRPERILQLGSRSRLELTEALSSAEAVCGAVRSLPYEQQLVIILNLLVGGDDQEIAEWTRRNVEQVRQIRQAAQSSLRRRLQTLSVR